MPANATGPWHVPARETGRLGHLYSPGAQRGPYLHFPYALDNGAYSCWTRRTNTWHEEKWLQQEPEWKKLIAWGNFERQRPLWAIVPDVVGNGDATLERWGKYAHFISNFGIPLAIAVQDGMTVEQVRALVPAPAVVCIGGTDEWKWLTVEAWAKAFPRTHLLRCNAPNRLDYLLNLGIESCDGTGWNRGDPKQTLGLMSWLYRNKRPIPGLPEVPNYLFCRGQRDQQTEIALLN